MNSAGNGRLEKSIFAHDPVLTPEKKLWRGVLEQAYADAELPLGPEADDELFIEQDRARRFLRADTPYEDEELQLVCDFADVPFDRVMFWARKRYPLGMKEVNDVEEVKEIKDRKGIAAYCGPSVPLPPLLPFLPLLP